MYVDICPQKAKVAIELKYATRKLELDLEATSQSFALPNQFAQNQNPHIDFRKDIHRLELMR